jgi:hypothetical protein
LNGVSPATGLDEAISISVVPRFGTELLDDLAPELSAALPKLLVIEEGLSEKTLDDGELVVPREGVGKFENGFRRDALAVSDIFLGEKVRFSGLPGRFSGLTGA